MKKIFPFLILGFFVCLFFWQFLIKGLLPIPSDTIIGLYHPFRDLYAKDYPSGIPFKNFLITDPVRQQYPWRELTISLEKKLQLPLWNPYSFSGTPLLANFQSAPFYPINFLFLIMPFSIAWSLIIFLGPLLAGIFLFLYLDNLRLSKWASLIGAFAFSFSGFFVSWLEWGTITHVGLWLPLILLSIDKLVSNKKNFGWNLVYSFALISSFFAGHLQTFFYLFIFSSVYFFARWMQFGWQKKILFLFIILNSLFIIFSSIQWLPTFQFIALSARNVDVLNFNNPGWFVPWQHLIQFVAPDFFGNPTTLNYWGVWNYGELIGYIGIIPLIFAIFSIFCRRDRKTLFFGTFLVLAIVFSFPTIFAKIPYMLKIPFLSTAQPTRLIFIIDFALAVLSALGFDYLLKTKRKIAILYPLIFVATILIGLWIFIPKEHMEVVKSNLILPTLLFIFASVIFVSQIVFNNKRTLIMIVSIILILATVFDLLRFGWKFTPFTQKSYFFPSTKTLTFLQKNSGEFRIMTTDSRILPPNFSTMYKIQSIDGYDPLYLLRYGELIAASERKKADISLPFGFNRIITPHNYDSKIIDLLGVKFVLSLSDIKSESLNKVFQEGATRIYENKKVLPRAFFVSKIISAKDNKDVIKLMFNDSFIPNDTAIIELNQGGAPVPSLGWQMGETDVVYYSENKVIVETVNSGMGFLVLTDSYYPTWHVTVDKVEAKIYRTDYNFRGVIIPEGKHKIEFYNSLF